MERPCKWSTVGIGCGHCRVAHSVHHGYCRRGTRGLRRLEIVPVIPSIKIPENASPRAWRQHDGILDGASVHERAVPQGEEEGLVLDNRSADTACELVIVIPVRLGGLKPAGLRVYGLVVEPGIRVQRSVSNRPHAGS